MMFELEALYDEAVCATDQPHADAFFERCVGWVLRRVGHGAVSRAAAEMAVREGLGYHAAWYDHETRVRVERLYLCEHPVLGPVSAGSPSEPVLALRSMREGQEMMRGLEAVRGIVDVSRCPACLSVFGLAQHAMREDGSVSVCAKCFAVMVLVDGGKVHLASDRDIDAQQPAFAKSLRVAHITRRWSQRFAEVSS